MSPEDVVNILGSADSVSKNHLGQRVEFRSFMNIGFSSGCYQKLNHIGFGRQMEDVHFNGIYFFKNPPINVIYKLMVHDNNPLIYLGFVVFLKLGISMTGFHDDDISQKSVSIFEYGAWDKRISKMESFTFP
jgi:hypothetical protein